MELIKFYAQNYQSKNKSCLFPTPKFYYKLYNIVSNACKVAEANQYSAERWVYDSFLVGKALESVGCSIIIKGYENLEKITGSCVFVSNHMSTLETFFLPSIIQPTINHTFVVKESLLKYPLLGPVLSARNPIAVTRTNPRQDLAKVLEVGQEKIAQGESLVIFPQGTRKTEVKADDFSSLATKLAKKANVPLIPIALKTSAWGFSSITKDLGKISPEIPIQITFGEPIFIESNNGKEEHQKSIDFIVTTYKNFA